VAEADNLNDNLEVDDCDLTDSRCFLSARFSRSDAIDLPNLGPDDVRFMRVMSACVQAFVRCARHETYTCIVELVGFNHDLVVSSNAWK
jgi:hypothetical protein